MVIQQDFYLKISPKLVRKSQIFQKKRFGCHANVWTTMKIMKLPLQNPLEKLAAIIMEHHTNSVQLIEHEKLSSGAEWWVQVKDVKNKNEANNPPVKKNTKYSNLYPYDKDEEIACFFLIGVYPQISTVTCLSSTPRANPTVVIFEILTSTIIRNINFIYILYDTL